MKGKQIHYIFASITEHHVHLLTAANSRVYHEIGCFIRDGLSWPTEQQENTMSCQC